MSLRIVLMGTGDFAVPAFRAVMQAHEVAAVVTQPDRVGKGHHRHVNVVKDLGTTNGVLVLQPEKASDSAFLDQLRALQPDLILVAAYGQILRRALLDIPRLGAFNLHGSLLPRHRGAAPVQYAIWSGDEETGVTMFRIEPALDSGPMCGVVRTLIQPQETSGELMQRLAELCVPMTLESLSALESGSATFRVQDTGLVTLAPKIPREAGAISWQQTCREVDCHVRAMQPWPKASTILRRSGLPDLRCILLKVDATDAVAHPSSASPGVVEVRHGELLVRTFDGWLRIVQLQAEGRKPMEARSFLNGVPVPAGSQFL